MAIYAFVVDSHPPIVSMLAILRQYSSDSLSTLKARMEEGNPVIVISTREFAPGVTNEEGVPLQHSKLRDLWDSIVAIGGSVRLLYAPSEEDHYEVIDRAAVESLFESEIEYLHQHHD
jgi:hypothetical protein